LSVTRNILISIGIHEPSYDDCYIIREVCKTVSLRAANLAAAGNCQLCDRPSIDMALLAIAVVINRLNLPSVTVGVDGTLFRHHEKFKKNLTRTVSRLVPRTVSHRSFVN
jgi:hexokinase